MAEGFSLIGSKDWLKIVRRMDCLLFGTTIKEEALEHCCSCVQHLAQYIPVQVPDGISQELGPSAGPPRASGSPGEGCTQSVPVECAVVTNDDYQMSMSTALQYQLTSRQHREPQQCIPAGTAASGGRTSVTWLAQSLLASKELLLVYEQSAWNAEEIGPFLRLCLMDHSFPAFVEDVEKNLKKLA
ncbi:hypothetical protein MC885_004802, partial [Smutsia gigantea]